MSTVVFLLQPDDVIDYANYYHQFQIPFNQPSVNLVLKIEGVRCTFYNSNKVVLQGEKAEMVLEVFFTRYWKTAKITPGLEEASLQEKKKQKTGFIWPSYVHSMVGSDEVGTGDYFGGVVVCAVRLTNEDTDFLNQLGVKDSKKLDDKFILKAVPQITKKIQHKIAAFLPQEYNSFYQKYQNANVVKTYLHYQAIQALQQPYDFTVVDEFVSGVIWENYLKKMDLKPLKINIMVPKAESQYLAVACASMIARYHFLNQIQTQSEQWKMSFALGGWNEKVKQSILNFLKEHSLEQLGKVAKLHFKNLEKIIEKV